MRTGFHLKLNGLRIEMVQTLRRKSWETVAVFSYHKSNSPHAGENPGKEPSNLAGTESATMNISYNSYDCLFDVNRERDLSIVRQNEAAVERDRRTS